MKLGIILLAIGCISAFFLGFWGKNGYDDDKNPPIA